MLFKYLYDKTVDLAKYVSTEHKDTHQTSNTVNNDGTGENMEVREELRKKQDSYKVKNG
mgnify:CR=1 FL=1